MKIHPNPARLMSLMMIITKTLWYGCSFSLVAYNAIGCLYIYISSCRKEKIILSTGILILVLLSFLVSSFINKYLRPSFIFWANIMAISPLDPRLPS